MEQYMKIHPTPWRIEVKPKGWGDSTVIYDKNNNVVLYEIFPPEGRMEMFVEHANTYKQKE